MNWKNVAAGTYTLRAKATDNAGFSATSAPVTVTLNSPPTVSLTSPNNNASFPAPATITLSANANDSDGSIKRVEFYNGGTLVGTATTAPFTTTWNDVGLGTYTLSAKAIDNHGASTTSQNIAINVISAQVAHGVYYVYADHLNTPRVITDTNNKPVWKYESDAFGNGAPNEDPSHSGIAFNYNLRFPGQYYDAETGLHYNWNRYYDPSTGRYISSDPIGLAGGLSTYTYVGGNPISYTDSTGLVIDTVWDLGNLIYDLWNQNWADAAADAAAMCVPGVPAGITKLRKLGPIQDAAGPHTVWKTAPDGQIIRHETYAPNPQNPAGWEKVQSTDVTGRPHFNKETGQYVPTPHTQGPSIPGGVRPALPNEIPRR